MTRIRRGPALIALVLAALVAIWLVVVLVLNIFAALVALVGLGIATVGAWWVAVERDARLWAGLGALVLGLGAVLIAIVMLVSNLDYALAQFVIVAALVGGASASVRAAVKPAVQATLPPRFKTVTPPKKAVLHCNPWSGGGKVDKFGLVEMAHDLGVETKMLGPGVDLENLARASVAEGADCLAMAGGDGSQALVASIAIEHDLPFVCISAGTRNHFALDLGLNRDDPREGMVAFTEGTERRIDYATCNGRLFVNNVSLGVYADIVQEDSYRDAKRETATSKLPELLGSTAEPFDLQFTAEKGDEVDGAFLILISNNPYDSAKLKELGSRAHLDTGELGVIAVSAASGSEAAALVTRMAVNLAGRAPGLHFFSTPSFSVRSRSGTASAGIDGEALELDTPLELRCHPEGLRMLVPEATLQTTVEREARSVTVSQVWHAVLGAA